jgi:predicted Rossmann-fold nucleotide-binding protein
MRRPLVGFMGGHGVPRNSDAYADIAHLARFLVHRGFLIVTGGGPGIMEAAHLGVAFSASPDGDLDAALKSLAAAPAVPSLDALFDADGMVLPEKIDALKRARNWLKVALDVRKTAPEILPVSLAIPTWLYGAEPTMPFATHYAKYYQNSLREEALVNNSRAGIIYGQGGGGTMREVFQDVERNYYSRRVEDFTPMIFFDRAGYWERDAVYDGETITKRGIRLDVSIPTILTFGLRGGGMTRSDVDHCINKVKFTVDHMEIANTLAVHVSAAERNLDFALAAQPMKVTNSRMNRH